MQSKSLSLKSLVYLGKFLAMGTTLSEQEIGRRESLQKLRDLGIDPYPAAAYDVSIYSKDCKAHYEEGKKVGIHKSWFENGQQKFEYPYNQKGFYQGALKEWFPNGQLIREFNYVEGKESGTQKMWLENGNIRANYTVIDGERFGLIGLKKCYSVNTNDEK